MLEVENMRKLVNGFDDDLACLDKARFFSSDSALPTS